MFRSDVAEVIGRSLALTAKLMFWVMLVMVPGALILGVLAGMREGSRTDRVLSTASIATTLVTTASVRRPVVSPPPST